MKIRQWLRAVFQGPPGPPGPQGPAGYCGEVHLSLDGLPHGAKVCIWDKDDNLLWSGMVRR